MTREEVCENTKEMEKQYQNNGCLYHRDYFITFYNSGEVVYVENGIDCISVIDCRTPER